MQKSLACIIALLAYFAVIAQYILMLQNRITPVIETTLRFFSFFTILTNTLVAVFFTYSILRKNGLKISVWRPGLLTAVTVYITVVGLVYQLVLRQIWEPTGLQKWVDELLHSIIPLLVLLYWFLYETKQQVRWKQIPSWLLYPFIYLLYILIRGAVSNFYPYPFVNVIEIGYAQVLINSGFLFLTFIFLSALLTGLGHRLAKSRRI